ncbi:hypothetical protein TpMuguga_01g00174 [Theileria parva strain Muguga]|uniref:ABM domain-containing protein n=1 Tax=Theileria parva TaxID=5875 RepID=Q4N9E0_THEPA|nr:uncharacterized protein TpMuguga_01g00174 [Theileria parva strain Muguga]EAN33418.1 hypothetical protein TpMuguga_01g00174 [Theileria parva strain Muguga]|eukprot:XP_765701.1 hypothetical protein [Theileria parva strain Muguga]
MSIFTVSFFNRSLSFVTSFMCVYAFANPDLERIWEFHPAFDQKDYAFLSFYKVNENDYNEFEKGIRGLTRYLQRKPGYGYTRLVRLVDMDDKSDILSDYDYVGVQTWFTPASMKRAMDSSFSQKIISNLKMKNDFNSQLFKIVVDDSSYTP